MKEKLAFGANPALKIAITFVSKLDQAALDQAVKTYESALDALTSNIAARKPDLEEARRSAPTYRSEEARSQAFGARSLSEFREQHKYTVDGDDGRDILLPVDLASQEGIHGSHPVDRHVGLSDEQLALRMRDQGPKSASSYRDLESAQHWTQEALNNSENEKEILDWIAKREEKIRNGSPKNQEMSTFEVTLEDQSRATGESVTASEYSAQGLQATGGKVYGVKVILKYKKDVDPPFVVLTSYPE